MPLLLLALLGAGSAYGAKRFWDSKHPKFFFWLDKGVTEEEKAGYSQALFMETDPNHIKDMAKYAYNKKHWQVAELLGERMLALGAADHPDVAVLTSKYPSAIAIMQLETGDSLL